MRKLALLAAASIAAMGISAAPAQAQVELVGQFEGNDCEGAGFSTCYASQEGVNVPGDLESAVVIKFDSEFNVDEISSNYDTITGDEFDFTFTDNMLSFTYTPGADDPILHYFDVKQADGYVLWYDPSGLSSVGPIDLDTFFPNNPGISHITFFDEDTPGVPEPATWAMMLLGFGATGVAMRRSRRRKGTIAQMA